MAKAPEAADIYAGAKLRFQRQIRNMSQTELAGALGITFQQVQKYEKGTNRISASRLQTIASILGVPVSFFFETGNDLRSDQALPSQTGETISGFLSSTEGIRLNRYFLAIEDADARRAVLNLVKAIAAMDDDEPSEVLHKS